MEERGRSLHVVGVVGGGFSPQEHLLTRVVLDGPLMNTSPWPSVRTLKVCTEALMGFHHCTIQMASGPPHSLKVMSLEQLPLREQ